MKSWEQVLQTAMLGTDKKNIGKPDLELPIGEYYEQLAAATGDREELFLQIGSLVYNYRQSGFIPPKEENLFLTPADAEVKPYASDLAHQVLHEVLESESMSLLRLWLERCNAAGAIVQPEEIPALLSLSAKHKNLRSLVTDCSGNRGTWLAPLNPEWGGSIDLSDEDAWQTGTLDQRKFVLAKIRKEDPDKGRAMLQEIWGQENAATRTELLDQLCVNISENDLTWLGEISGDKSVKVKDKAFELLKLIPSSPIMQQYETILLESIRLVTTKGLLGIGAKNNFEISLAGMDDAVFKSGIQQLSSDKAISDDFFILQQLIAEVHPAFWQKHYNLAPGKIIEIFAKNKQQQLFIVALGNAAVKFADAEWALAFAHSDQATFLEDLVDLLPQKEAERYVLKFLASDESIMKTITKSSAFRSEWSYDFAKQVMKIAAANVYQYNRSFYDNIIYQLPVTIGTSLADFAPKQDYYGNVWNKMSEHISSLINLKQRTIKAFNQ